jgi:hypothetical protein
MYRVYFYLALMAAAAWWAPSASAKSFRFPESGPYAFTVDLPQGWQSKTDKRGGVLLIAPGERALLYLGIVKEEALRGKPERAIAEGLAKIAGIEHIENQGAARISDTNGTSLHRGTAFSGLMPAKHGLARKAKIIIFNVAPATWAQVWTVTQPGINPVESEALDRLLNGLSLAAGRQ